MSGWFLIDHDDIDRDQLEHFDTEEAAALECDERNAKEGRCRWDWIEDDAE